MRLQIVAALLFASWLANAQPKRVLYVTHSAGFRHDSIPVSADALRKVADASGRIEITHTEDLSAISAVGLRDFDAVVFFTSGELPLNDQQKSDLLAFVRTGRGFGGVHSATDTLYSWPAYGDLIGAYFDGHPWVQQVRIDVEDPEHPSMRGLAPSFSITDEIYQFRNFSRANVRVLMTLDTTSVDVHAPGVNRSDEDFALAWVRPYGDGRVFYTALGHFDETWRNPRFQNMMLQAMLWLTGEEDGEAQPRRPLQPLIYADAVGNSATMMPLNTISPGTLFSVYGQNLTVGSTMAADRAEGAAKLAGATIRIDGRPLPTLFASPGQVNAIAPMTLEGRPCRQASGSCIQIDVITPGTAAASALVAVQERTPGIFTTTVMNNIITLWTTGLGRVRQSASFSETVWEPNVLVNRMPARVVFSGLAPGWVGLYQIQAVIPDGAQAPFECRIID